MAKQNKSRKFFATTATAALVASAIVPVASAAELKDFDQVPAWAKDAVKFLADNDYVQGDENGNFKPASTLLRSQAAEILAKVNDLEATGTENFPDVASKDWFYNAVLATTPEIFQGDDKGNFNPNQKLTRQEAAVVIVKAFGLTGSENLNSFKDASKVPAWAKAQFETAVANGVINGKNGLLAPTDDISNAEFATMIKRAIDASVPAVNSVSATNSTTLTVTGNKLGEFKAEDVTVENNTVKSYVASADGKTATITLNAQLVPDVATKVKVKDKEFEVTYKIAASKVAVVEATYDDDLANQFIAIQVDGKSVTAQELINAGYSLEFHAYDSKAATTSVNTKLFGTVSDAASTTGELETDLATEFSVTPAGVDLYVKATLTKGSEVFTSDLTKITIKNLDLAADSITKHTLLNVSTGFNQASTTLVTGETARFTDITVKAGTEEDKVNTGYSVKSSNDAVISVTGGVLKAEGPGTATVTVTYGKTTYTKTFTVTNNARKATNISVNKTAVTLVGSTSSTATANVKLLDQYGDPMTIVGGTNVKVANSDDTKATVSLGNTSSASGNATLTFTGVNGAKGTTLVTFRDAANVKIGTAAVTATVTDNDTLSKYSLTLDDAPDAAAISTLFSLSLGASEISDDAILDINADKYVKIDLAGLNSAGVKVVDQKNKAAEYTVTVAQSAAGVLDATNPVYEADGAILVQAGNTVGTATITVTNDADNKVVATYKVTVEEKGLNVTGATLKTPAAPTYATTLTYKNFLTYAAADKDPVITGLTLTKSSAQPVRLDIDGDTGSAIGTLYIDKNADGEFVAADGDVIVGTVEITTTGSIDATGPFAVTTGVAVASGDEGSVLFKVVDNQGKVVATKAVKVDF